MTENKNYFSGLLNRAKASLSYEQQCADLLLIHFAYTYHATQFCADEDELAVFFTEVYNTFDKMLMVFVNAPELLPEYIHKTMLSAVKAADADDDEKMLLLIEKVYEEIRDRVM